LTAGLIASGCVLHARDFVPPSGSYTYVFEQASDGGRQEHPVLILTGTVDSTLTMVEVSTERVDAGHPPRFVSPDARNSALVYVVAPDSGQLQDRAEPPAVLLPADVTADAKWRYYEPGPGSCPLDARVTAISGGAVEVAIDVVCPGAVSPLARETWRVRDGLVETSEPDGGNRVRFERR
jgi:hypothetical protein